MKTKGTIIKTAVIGLVLVAVLGSSGISYAKANENNNRNNQNGYQGNQNNQNGNQGNNQNNGNGNNGNGNSQPLTDVVFKWAESNDNGTPMNIGGYNPIDPGDNGNDTFQHPVKPGDTVLRSTMNVAQTLAVKTNSQLITVTVNNAYPGYAPTVFFEIDGETGRGATPGVIENIIVNHSPELGVTIRGIKKGDVIENGKIAIGMLDIDVKDTAQENTAYTLTVKIKMAQWTGQDDHDDEDEHHDHDNGGCGSDHEHDDR
jgi:type II secretory pathway pseudopilin PulG